MTIFILYIFKIMCFKSNENYIDIRIYIYIYIYNKILIILILSLKVVFVYPDQNAVPDKSFAVCFRKSQTCFPVVITVFT